MLALHPRTVDAVWAAVEPLIPVHVPKAHPLGCHRRRIADRVCFEGILRRLVTGCSWDVAGRISGAGETTLRRRRTEWTAAGVFEKLRVEATAAYDRIIGLDLSEIAIDGSQHKAPFGGEGTGPNPTDRGRIGWKWSILTDRNGIPLAWAIDGANRNDMVLLGPTLGAFCATGLVPDVETLHLDKGYDNTVTIALTTQATITDLICAKRRKPGEPKAPVKAKNGSHTLGLRWPVERTNSWFTNYGQLRRNTDRLNSPVYPSTPHPDRPRHRLHPHHKAHQMGRPLEPHPLTYWRAFLNELLVVAAGRWPDFLEERVTSAAGHRPGALSRTSPVGPGPPGI